LTIFSHDKALGFVFFVIFVAQVLTFLWTVTKFLTAPWAKTRFGVFDAIIVNRRVIPSILHVFVYKNVKSAMLSV